LAEALVPIDYDDVAEAFDIFRDAAVGKWGDDRFFGKEEVAEETVTAAELIGLEVQLGALLDALVCNFEGIVTLDAEVDVPQLLMKGVAMVNTLAAERGVSKA